MVNHRHKMISNMRYSIGIYERFYKVQRAAIFEYLNTNYVKILVALLPNLGFNYRSFQSKSRLKLDSSEELKIAG
jgi:hypothetical protein